MYANPMFTDNSSDGLDGGGGQVEGGKGGQMGDICNSFSSKNNKKRILKQGMKITNLQEKISSSTSLDTCESKDTMKRVEH